VPIVLVHGNPETDAVWDLLAARLAERGYDDQRRLAPAGFAAPLPAEFDATAKAYRAWLIGELERISGPVDLVGHDWGGGHVLGVAMTRPDLLRSWCSDAIGIFDPDYVWHPLAQIWQTPQAGEEWVAGQLAQGPTHRAAFLAGEQRRRAAARAGAEVVAELPGLSHWWMTENDGRAGAQALAAFWSSLPA
jgi:pimeloyl-ACP methyl ester carboxylesterase